MGIFIVNCRKTGVSRRFCLRDCCKNRVRPTIISSGFKNPPILDGTYLIANIEPIWMVQLVYKWWGLELYISTVLRLVRH